MSDSDFIKWIHDRLINVYGENKNVDFVQRLDRVWLNLRKIENAFEIDSLNNKDLVPYSVKINGQPVSEIKAFTIVNQTE
jgi:hypothetical protein